MERETGFQPATSTYARSHSTTELLPLNLKTRPRLRYYCSEQSFRTFGYSSLYTAVGWAQLGAEPRVERNMKREREPKKELSFEQWLRAYVEHLKELTAANSNPQSGRPSAQPTDGR